MPPGVYKHKPRSEETKIKISIFNKGKKLSEEHKRKISESLKKIEKRPWLGANKGRKFSEEIRKRMSDGRKKFYKNGGIHPLKGMHRPLETRNKISKKLDCGLSGEGHKIRNRIEYSLWRQAVFARDNFTCQKTKVRGGVLRAHHIKNFAEYPELRFAIDNGITLSEKSHKDFHKKYGSSNNTLDQLKEFLNN